MATVTLLKGSVFVGAHPYTPLKAISVHLRSRILEQSSLVVERKIEWTEDSETLDRLVTLCERQDADVTIRELASMQGLDRVSHAHILFHQTAVFHTCRWYVYGTFLRAGKSIQTLDWDPIQRTVPVPRITVRPGTDTEDALRQVHCIYNAADESIRYKATHDEIQTIRKYLTCGQLFMLDQIRLPSLLRGLQETDIA